MGQEEETNSCNHALEAGAGYYTGFRLTEGDLARARRSVQDHWRAILSKHYPRLATDIGNLPMDEYHVISEQVDHAGLWTKRTRILDQAECETLHELELFTFLGDQFGDFLITDDEGSGYGEIYWRLVRPGARDDIGPMHADSWFWKLGHGIPPGPGKKRVKIWVALWCDPGMGGLMVIPESQKREWPFYGEIRHGFTKPKSDINFAALNPKLVESPPGTAIIFSDDLLHGGAVTTGEHTRINLEFSIMLL